MRGVIRANVGPRILIVAEELNLAIPRLRAFWDERSDHGDPKRSPALAAIGELAFAGRQVYMNVVLIGQMLTASATGSRDSSVKENVGIKALARYSPKNWAVMAPEHPMPRQAVDRRPDPAGHRRRSARNPGAADRPGATHASS